VAQTRAKARHDQHRTSLEFHLADKVWLKLDKQRFKGKHHKLHLLRSGPYKILECIGDNAYKLELPPQFGIHDVLDFNNLKRFEPYLVDEDVVVQHLVDIILDLQPPPLEDTILEQRTRHTRSQEYTSYLVGKKGELPVKARWLSSEKIKT